MLKNSNFLDFLSFLPPILIEQYIQYKQLQCPADLNSVEFIEWIDSCLAKLGKNRTDLIELCGIEKTKFSKYMNNKGPIDQNNKLQIKNYLETKLIESGLMPTSTRT